MTSISIHPLLQGADRISAKMRQKSPDSSPPTRGRLALHFPGIIRRRLIPSREGQTHCFLIRHPVDCESSPPARGKRRSGNSLLCRTRFIPSYDGQTIRLFPKFPDHTIHPFIRGANVALPYAAYRQADSSPHTRGKPFSVYTYRCTQLFIPSYDGQTMAKALKVSRPTIHPLIRGANCQ